MPIKTKKAIIDDGLPQRAASTVKPQGRGYQVISASQLLNITAVGRDGQKQNVPIDAAWTSVDPMTALQIYQRCPPVFAVISNRANRIAAVPWHVEPLKREHERIAEELKTMAEVYREQDPNTWPGLVRRMRLYNRIRHYLKDLRPDLTNFEAALRRWVKHCKRSVADRCDEIREFFEKPNQDEDWTAFCKQIVVDLMLHGRNAIYKANPYSLHMLAGGTIIPVVGATVTEGRVGYVQLPQWAAEPQLFYRDEVSYAQYLPNSAVAQGMTPIDALVNMVTENMLFDRYMAEKADGTNPPEKVLVFGDEREAIDLMGSSAPDAMDVDEQRRIEQKLNTPTKDLAVATLTGYGTPFLADISKNDIIDKQMARQDQIKKLVGLVYGATNMELNESGSDGTSGRTTSESQERIELERGIRAIITIIESQLTNDIMPALFGDGYCAKFETQRSLNDKFSSAKEAVATGAVSVNEIREQILDLYPFPEEEYDRPAGQLTAEDGMAGALDEIARKL